METAIKVPGGVKVGFTGRTLTITGKMGKVEREIEESIHLATGLETITLKIDGIKGRHKALLGSYTAHINNMIKGVTEGMEKKLKIVFLHFPINAKVEGNEIVIKNFLGEKSVRKAKIREGVKVEVKGDEIIVTGPDIERVGQTAANIEKASKYLKRKDKRVFQDGIYMLRGDK